MKSVKLENIGQSELNAQRELIAQLVRGVEMEQTVSVGPADLDALHGLQNMLDCIEDQVNPVCDDSAETTDVVFLRDRDGGDVFAVFPGIAATVGQPDHMGCYHHIGQHSAAALQYCIGCAEVTDPAAYADLKGELEHIGYRLRVVGKDRIRDSVYADQRRTQLSRV
jgi:hypothetical protein